jgi:hypothetical protein
MSRPPQHHKKKEEGQYVFITAFQRRVFCLFAVQRDARGVGTELASAGLTFLYLRTRWCPIRKLADWSPEVAAAGRVF